MCVYPSSSYCVCYSLLFFHTFSLSPFLPPSLSPFLSPFLPPFLPPSLSAVVKQFQGYSDPEEPAIATSSEEEGVVLPLGDTTLTCNLGMPVIVVCCKVCVWCVCVWCVCGVCVWCVWCVWCVCCCVVCVCELVFQPEIDSSSFDEVLTIGGPVKSWPTRDTKSVCFQRLASSRALVLARMES